MNAAKQASWLFIVILCLACSGWYFAGNTVRPSFDANALLNTADMVVHQLKVYQFDTQGRLTHALETPFMRHIPLNNTHWLKTPRIFITDNEEPTWAIQAEEATALGGGHEITFNHHVVIHQNSGPHTEASDLKTETMTYFPKDKRATTNEWVLYQRSGSMIESRGMTAYLAEKRVQLLSHAKGSYAPHRG